MQSFPIFGRHHLDSVPGATIKESAIRTFARAFLATDTKIGINFDSAERRVILVRHPEHASLDGTVFDARGRAGTTSAAIRGDRQNARFLLPARLAVAFRHGPMFVNDVVHACDVPYSEVALLSPTLT
jgi:hypothetical protein